MIDEIEQAMRVHEAAVRDGVGGNDAFDREAQRMTNTTDRSRLLTVLDNEHMRAVALGDTAAALILQDAMNAIAALMDQDR